MIRLFLIVLPMICAAAHPLSAQIKIASGGNAEAVIIRQAGVTAEESKAVDELAGFLEQATNAKFSIQNESVNVSPNTTIIIVGQGATAKREFPEIDFEKFGGEQIVVRAKNRKLLIAGGRPAGTLNAVYKFLQDFVGIRWWTPWATDIPRKSELLIPAEVNITEKPAFEMRLVGWFYALYDKEWVQRNMLTAECNCPGWVHTFYELVPPEEYFESHPEWYGMINGRRSRTAQLCLSNKELREFVAERVKTIIRENPTTRFVSVSQMDWERSCDCDSCRQLIKQTDGHSGALMDFVNDIARRVKADYPKTKIHTLAYHYTEQPPSSEIKADDHVIVQFCPIERSHSAAFDEQNGGTAFAEMRDWSKAAENLYIWDYPANLTYYPLPHPNWLLLGQNVRAYWQNGVKGVYVQGAFNSNGAEMAELRSWLYARLLWNPNQDDEALIQEFLNGYYGQSAAPYLRRYFDLMSRSNVNFNLTPSADENRAPFLKFEVLSQAEELFQQAEAAAAKENAEKLWRVQQAHLSVQFAFLLRWDALRAEAENANKRWLFDVSREEYARHWFETATGNGDAPARGWTKPTFLGEVKPLTKEIFNSLIYPPAPLIEKRENFLNAWLDGWTRHPTSLMWLGVILLLSPWVFRIYMSRIIMPVKRVDNSWRTLRLLEGAAFACALAIYSWWQPFWTGSRLLILFAPLAASVLLSLLALSATAYHAGFRRAIVVQSVIVILLASGLIWQLKPYFRARYDGNHGVLGSVNLSRANLYSTNLEGVDLEGADLHMAYFREAWLGYADLRGTDLREANFQFATLTATIFDYADLRGADFRNALLADVRLTGAKYNNQTKFPADFNPADYGAIYTEE